MVSLISLYSLSFSSNLILFSYITNPIIFDWNSFRSSFDLFKHSWDISNFNLWRSTSRVSHWLQFVWRHYSAVFYCSNLSSTYTASQTRQSFSNSIFSKPLINVLWLWTKYQIYRLRTWLDSRVKGQWKQRIYKNIFS